MTDTMMQALELAARLGADAARRGWTPAGAAGRMAVVESGAMARYWVCGGEYTDTSFTELVGGGEETRLGPFASYEEAREVWRARAMATVDSAHARFRIEKEGGDRFWVVGGKYADTSFSTLAAGAGEERLGPFASYEEAKDVWRARAMATVDDAHARYRIEHV